MNIEDIGQKLSKNEIVYIRDDYEQIVIRLIPNSNFAFAKFKGRTEYSIDKKTKLVFDVKQNGEEITQKEYEEY